MHSVINVSPGFPKQNFPSVGAGITAGNSEFFSFFFSLSNTRRERENFELSLAHFFQLRAARPFCVGRVSFRARSKVSPAFSFSNNSVSRQAHGGNFPGGPFRATTVDVGRKAQKRNAEERKRKKTRLPLIPAFSNETTKRVTRLCAIREKNQGGREGKKMNFASWLA